PLGQLTLEPIEPQRLPSLLSELPQEHSSGTETPATPEASTTFTRPEPAAPTTTVGMLALDGVAQDLGEKSDLLTDLLQSSFPKTAHRPAELGHGSHATCATAGCGGEFSSCGSSGTAGAAGSAVPLVHSGHCGSAASSHDFALAAMANVPLPTLGATNDPSLQSDGIHTPHDDVPDFGAQPTIVSVRNGTWSNPLTWSAG